jgi:uncharacterized protein YlzI (FlbEa/FlbD family)
MGPRMHSNWVKCTLEDGRPIYINFDIARSFGSFEKGTRIDFVNGEFDRLVVIEKPDEILEKLSKMKEAVRS